MKLLTRLGLIISIFVLLAVGAAAGLMAVYCSREWQMGPLGVVGLVLALVVITMLVIIIATYVINQQIARPLRELSAGVSRVTLGDLSQVLDIKGKDELGLLGRDFNEMTRQLAATHRSLQAATRMAQDEQARLESSINSLRQGFILTDDEAKVIMVNDAAWKMIGDAHVDVKQKRAAVEGIKRALPADLELMGRIAETMKDHRPVRLSALAMGARYVNLYLSPVVSSRKTIGCALLLEDVTEERILARTRDEFFSIASHELRTPLTAIRGNSAMLTEYYPSVTQDKSAMEMLGDIHDASVRLIEIVDDFLDVSRLEQNKLKLDSTAFYFEPVVEKIVYELAGLSKDKGVALKFKHKTLASLPMVYADVNRVKQVLYNLIGNALKFTSKGSVAIDCKVEGNHLRVSVEDTGQGISPQGQQLLFRKFQQATSDTLTRDNTRGTGLGLYISRLLMEHMGGDVILERSEVDKGSRFSFAIPLATKEQLKAASESA